MQIVEKCTGCMACFNACKFDAIKIEQNEKGFYVPKIDETKCKKCGLCKKVCPELNEVNKNEVKNCYAGWTLNKNVRKESTSGGLFAVLATMVLNKGGVVVGAMFDNNFKVVHGIVDKVEDLYKLQGSKYVQSYLGDVYIKAKNYLDSGKFVLFSGVSCQIAGLKNFLNKDYENLITIDVLCHGAPSPKVFSEYLLDKNFKDIKEIKFRAKKPSWTVFSMQIKHGDNKEYSKDTLKDEYIRLFLDDYITNDVCASCKYVGTSRCSDITLADFWGYISEKFSMRNTEKGISLILTNTDKGNKLIESIKDEIILIEKDIEEAKAGNQCLRVPFKKNKNYDNFWNDYIKEGYFSVKNKYFKEKNMKMKRRVSLFINDHAYIIPKKMREKIFSVKYKMKGRM